jgi:hypothetical protein
VPDQTNINKLFDQLMAINQDAFSAKLFDTAYHSLAAALHCARTLGSDQQLGEIEKTARDQIAWIDQNEPEYEHSTISASRRSHKSVFVTLAQQADTILKMRQANRKRKERGF